MGLFTPRVHKVFKSSGKTKDGRDIARPIKGRLNPGRLAALRTCYSLFVLTQRGDDFLHEKPLIRVITVSVSRSVTVKLSPTGTVILTARSL